MEKIVVGISDVKTCTGPAEIVTYALGSCVGICMRDGVNGVSGMAHIMLPDSTAIQSDSNKMKFAQLLSGREVADKLLQEVKTEVAQLKGRPPCVAFLRVGNDGASVSYVRQKEAKAAFTGIKSLLKVFDAETTTETQLLEEIEQLNQDDTIDGILVQAPVPNSMDFVKICNTIHPHKDVDGFGTTNLGNLLQDRPGLVPCTPAGIIELLKYYQIQLIQLEKQTIRSIKIC